MALVLRDPPKNQNDAFSALESAVGSEAFEADEGIAIVANELGIDDTAATQEIRRLIQMGCVEEA